MSRHINARENGFRVNVPTPGLLGVVSEDHQDEFVKMFETVEWFIMAGYTSV